MVTVGTVGTITVFITTLGDIPHGDTMIPGMLVHSDGDSILGTVAIMVTDIPAITVTEVIMAVGTTIIIMTTGEAEALHTIIIA
jgi:hypothetical protein